MLQYIKILKISEYYKLQHSTKYQKITKFKNTKNLQFTVKFLHPKKSSVYSKMPLSAFHKNSAYPKVLLYCKIGRTANIQHTKQ